MDVEAQKLQDAASLVLMFDDVEPPEPAACGPLIELLLTHDIKLIEKVVKEYAYLDLERAARGDAPSFRWLLNSVHGCGILRNVPAMWGKKHRYSAALISYVTSRHEHQSQKNATWVLGQRIAGICDVVDTVRRIKLERSVNIGIDLAKDDEHLLAAPARSTTTCVICTETAACVGFLHGSIAHVVMCRECLPAFVKHNGGVVLCPVCRAESRIIIMH